MMRVLLDTNIVLDVLLNRTPFVAFHIPSPSRASSLRGPRKGSQKSPPGWPQRPGVTLPQKHPSVGPKAR